MEYARGYAHGLAGPEPVINDLDCTQCGNKRVAFLIKFQWKPQDKSGFANVGRYYVLCLAGKECKPRFVTDAKSKPALEAYEKVHDECVRNANSETNALKEKKKAVTLAFNAAQAAATASEGVSEAAAELAETAKRALAVAKTSLQATSLVSSKINGTTHVVRRRATGARPRAAEASSSSPAKRKSDGDSSPSARAKRAKVQPEASSSKGKSPKAGPSKLPVKVETIRGEKVYVIDSTDDEVERRDLSPEL